MEIMIQKAQFSGEEYKKVYSSDAKIRPLIHFFKYFVQRHGSYGEQTDFVSKSKLRIWISYTVVYGVEENPILYYTGEDGYVVRIDNVSSRTVLKKLTHGAKNENELTVVMKRPLQGEIPTNHTSLLNTKQLKTVLEQQSPGICVFQRYVKSKGPKASITRVAWSANKPYHGYTISNKKSTTDMSEKEPMNRLLTVPESPHSVNIYKMSGKAVFIPGSYTQHLLNYLQNTCRCKFKEFVADFIHDDHDRWWFIQVKAFILDDINIPKPIPKYEDISTGRKSRARSEYIRLKACKMCLNMYSPEDLLFTMSLKMIYATENHLKRRAVRLAWFDRPEFNSITDTSMWYQAHKVCKNCFDMYLQEQKLAKVEVEFAKAIGIPVNEKAHHGASILTTLSSKLKTAVQSKRNPDGGNYQSVNPKELLMFRFITYLNELRNIPDAVPEKICLKMKIFSTETVIQLKIENLMMRQILPIGKLRVFYFFARKLDDFRSWIKNCKEIVVQLCIGDEILGHASLALNQFASGLIDKLDYMVLFNTYRLKLCSLRATMGFVQMKTMDLSNVKLVQLGPIFIPPEDFFTADPLPSEWMEVIPRLSTQVPLDNIAKLDSLAGRSSAIPDSYASDPYSNLSLPNTTRSHNSFFSYRSRPSSANYCTPTPSKILQRRASSASRFRNQEIKIKNTRNSYSRPSSANIYRPHSAPSYKNHFSRKSRIMQNELDIVRGGNQIDKMVSKKIHETNEQENKDHSCESKVQYNANENIYHINIKIGSVVDLSSEVDESWNLSFNLFNMTPRSYESFQLLDKGPLVFDKEEDLYIACSESNIHNYFLKERVFKLVLTPKYRPDEERVAAIDLRQFQKVSHIDLMVPVEQISAEEVDNTKFMEVESEDDEIIGEEDDETHERKQKEKREATIKVTMSVKKLNYPTNKEDPPIIKIHKIDDQTLKLLDPEWFQAFGSTKRAHWKE